jgi:hypothetical protein
LGAKGKGYFGGMFGGGGGERERPRLDIPLHSHFRVSFLGRLRPLQTSSFPHSANVLKSQNLVAEMRAGSGGGLGADTFKDKTENK